MARSRQRSDETQPLPAQMPTVEALRQELLAELDEVRWELREAIEAFRLRLEGQIAQVQEALMTPDPAADESGLSPRASALAAMLDQVRRLRVKPEKGRRRDLKRMEALIETLRDQVTSW